MQLRPVVCCESKGPLGKLYDEKFRTSQSSPNKFIIMMIKLSRMRLAGHVSRMEKMKTSYQI
jgi:hypothetical protein